MRHLPLLRLRLAGWSVVDDVSAPAEEMQRGQ